MSEVDQLKQLRQKVETAVEDTIAGLDRDEPADDYQLGFDAGANETTKAMYAAFDALSSSPSVGASDSFDELEARIGDPVCARCKRPKSEHVPGPPTPPKVAGHLGATSDQAGCCNDFQDPAPDIKVAPVIDHGLVQVPTQDKEEKSSGVEVGHWRISNSDEKLTSYIATSRTAAIANTTDRLIAFFEAERETSDYGEVGDEAAEMVDDAQRKPHVELEQDGVSITYFAASAQPKEVPGEECSICGNEHPPGPCHIEDTACSCGGEGARRDPSGKLGTDCPCNGTGKKPPEVVGEAARNARNLLMLARNKGPAVKAEAVDSAYEILDAALTQPAVSEVPGEQDALNAFGEIASRIGRIRVYLDPEVGALEVDAASALRDADEAAEYCAQVRAALRTLHRVPGNSGGVEEGPEFTVNAPGELLAEEHREVGELVKLAHAKMGPGSLKAGVEALRDELQELLDRHAPQLPHSPLSDRAEGVRAERRATVERLDGLLLAAPTQPQLSDEDRERLRLIAFDLEGEEGRVEETPAERAAFLRKIASQQPEEEKPKALTLDQKAAAEIEGAATGQCPFCEGGMDAFGGIHAKDCPMLARPVLKATSPVTEPGQQHGEVEEDAG